MWWMGVELRASGRAVSAPNHSAVPPGPALVIKTEVELVAHACKFRTQEVQAAYYCLRPAGASPAVM